MANAAITKGTRVEHTKTRKIGTATADPYESFGLGQCVYVFWDGQKQRVARPCCVKNLRVVEG